MLSVDVLKKRLQSIQQSKDSVLDLSGFSFSSPLARSSDANILRSFLLDPALPAASLSELSLVDCALGDANCKSILSAITFHASIKKLVMKGNRLTSDVCEAIASYLQSNAIIEHLDLSNNDLGSDDANFALLSSGVASNTSLRQLDLRSNNLTSYSARRLAEAVFNGSQRLSVVDLRWNQAIGTSGGNAIVKVLKTVSSLGGSGLSLTLYLDGCSIPSEVLEIISGFLALESLRKKISDREQFALQAAQAKMDQALELSDKKVRLLTDELTVKAEALKTVDDRWLAELSQLTEELASCRASAVSTALKLATTQSELALEKQSKADIQVQLAHTVAECRTLATRAANAEMQIADIDESVSKQSAQLKEQTERKVGDANAEASRLKVALEDCRKQRENLEERVATLVAERATLEHDLHAQKRATDLVVAKERSEWQDRLNALERRWLESSSSIEEAKLVAERHHSTAMREAADEMGKMQRTIREMTQALATAESEASEASRKCNEAHALAQTWQRDGESAVAEAKKHRDDTTELRRRCEVAEEGERHMSETVRELERKLAAELRRAEARERQIGKLSATLKNLAEAHAALNAPLIEATGLLASAASITSDG